MSAADHSENAHPPSAVAARLHDADFVRFVATPDGDALAATGVLARALQTPFQASVAWESVGESEADVTVTVGRPEGDVALTDEPLAATAHAIARELDWQDPTLALAGVVAAGREPGEYASLLETSGLERHPGVGVPIDDIVDGLAHTTLAHAPFSGDEEATAEALTGVDRSGQAVASLLALSVVDEPGTRASESIERVLSPYELDNGEPFATLAGYADVLDAVARTQSGTGLALVLGHSSGDAALTCWREHARVAHEAVHQATLARYSGFVVARVPNGTASAATGTVARLVRDFRSPESIVLAVAGEHVAVAAADRDVSTAVSEAASAVGATAHGRGQHSYVALNGETDEADSDAFVDAFREAL